MEQEEAGKQERNQTVEHTASGKWFVTLCREVEIEPRVEQPQQSIGIDMGIHNYAVLYNGSDYEHIENPRVLEKLLDKLAKEQRKLCRMRECETKEMRAMKVHSNNYEKQRKKVAKLHERITNVRNDFLHKLSRRLVNENQAINIESLEIKKMLESGEIPNLSKRIADASWGRFFSLLEYKAQEEGVTITKADKDFPSTCQCSYCGHIFEVPLSKRKITCPNCKNRYDRDENAAKNLFNYKDVG